MSRYVKILRNFENLRCSDAVLPNGNHSAYEYTIPAHGKECIKTDLSIAIPPGTYGRVAPRSGLAAKHFIDTGAGVIDEDYRGNVMVLLFNHSDVDFKGEMPACIQCIALALFFD